MAEAATMLVNSIFQSQAQPYGLLHDFVKDALLYKAGVLRCGYDTEVTYTNERYEGLTELDVAALTNEPDVEVLEKSPERPEPEPPERPEANCDPTLWIGASRLTGPPAVSCRLP